MNNQTKKFTEDLAIALKSALETPESKAQIEKIKASGDTGRFKVVISTADIDRHGESVRQDGWDLENYKKNPIVLWGHEHWSMPIGMTESIEVIEGKLVAEGVFAPSEVNPLAQQIRAAYDLGLITATSVGFIVKEMVGNEITKAELLEFSFVPIPANPNVENLLKERNLDIAEFVAKGIISNVKEGEMVENPAKEENKEEKANKKEVTSEQAGAIMADLQTKVDTAITDAAIALQDLAGNEKSQNNVSEKAGRVLSAKNRELISKAVSALQELLEATEPEDGKQLEKVEETGGDFEQTMKSLNDFLAARSFLRSVDNAVGSALESMNKKIRERSKKN